MKKFLLFFLLINFLYCSNVLSNIYEFVKDFHQDNIHSIKFDPQGKFISIFSHKHNKHDYSNYEFKLWNLQTGNCEQTLEHDVIKVSSAEFDATGKFVLTICRDNTVRLWNVQTGKCLQIFQHDAVIDSAVFDSINQVILSKTYNSTFIWNIETGECLQTF